MILETYTWRDREDTEAFWLKLESEFPTQHA